MSKNHFVERRIISRKFTQLLKNLPEPSGFVGIMIFSVLGGTFSLRLFDPFLLDFRREDISAFQQPVREGHYKITGS